MKFEKPAKSLDELIILLQERGLIIEDIEKAKHSLSHIGYYRLTGYFKFFQDKNTNIFQSGTTFEQVLDLYIFDRKLRLLTLDAIEKIEVSIKAVMNDYLSQKYGIFWYLDEGLFALEVSGSEEKTQKNKEIYKDLKSKIKGIPEKKSVAIFVKEYFKKYDEETHLPSWMLFEELTVGEILNIYRLLKTQIKQDIANAYGVYQLELQIRIHLIVYIRNICAHHSRLWNKEYTVKPRTKDTVLGKKYKTYINTDTIEVVIPHYYNVALIFNNLLKRINKNFEWINDLESLFSEFSSINKEKMGFDQEWRENFT